LPFKGLKSSVLTLVHFKAYLNVAKYHGAAPPQSTRTLVYLFHCDSLYHTRYNSTQDKQTNKQIRQAKRLLLSLRRVYMTVAFKNK